MSSMFAFPNVTTQDHVPDHACSMTRYTNSIIACAWLRLKLQNPYDFLSHHTNDWRRLTQSAVSSRSQSQGARGGPDSGVFSGTLFAQIALVLSKPLQVVALKNKGVLTVQPHPLSEERLPRQQVFAASCAMLPVCSTLLCCKIWILRFTVVLFCHKPGYPSLCRSSPAQLTSVACAFNSVSQ